MRCPLLYKYFRSMVMSYNLSIILRTLLETALELQINAYLNIKHVNASVNKYDWGSLALAMLYSIIITLMPFWIFFKLLLNRSKLQSERFNEKYGTLYGSFHNNIGCYLYYPLFLIRRQIFAVLLIFLYEDPDYQCMIFNFMALFFLFY